MKRFGRARAEEGCRELAATAAGAARAFFRAAGPSQAAALAFYALLSCIPLFFVMLAGYDWLAGESWTAQTVLRRQMADVMPFFDEVMVARARRLLWAWPGLGWSSVAFILWSSWLFVGALGRALAQPWREDGTAPRTWPARLAAVAKGPLVGALFVAAMTAAVSFAHLPRLEPAGSLARKLSPLWGAGSLTGLFVAVYLLFLPRRRPLRLLVGLSAGLAALAYGVSAAFTALVAGLPRYHLVYGPLSGAILFLLWLDYNAWVLLWGAWFMRTWQGRHPPAPGPRRPAVARWLSRLRRRAADEAARAGRGGLARSGATGRDAGGNHTPPAAATASRTWPQPKW
ncbi:MAG: YhjD/YihY/BrkB family envelope integrity protein [Solidesulfovibrio sp. DCME]|uniref:YhjD/YihY/BrkB family envelope integrity protein n=1 Tax=Solidesulfovibrio sp. DCME TaxID=3447380 RepID=UPI003D135C3F